VREGISKTAPYGAVTLRGDPFDASAFGGELELEDPDGLRLLIHEHPAGALPILVARHRGDFETLVRAIAWRGEPRPISPAVSAQIVTGFINWDRLRSYRATWSTQVDPAMADRLWPFEMGRLAESERWRFQDRFVIVGVRAYSGVPAATLGLDMDEDTWVHTSTTLRVEHEMTHYATHRVYGAMSLNLLDETIADFMGATFALGRFEASWLLTFLGLEAWPAIREDGRLRTYTRELSPDAVALLARVTVAGAAGLQRIAEQQYHPAERERFFLALAGMTLELLAAPDAVTIFEERYAAAGRLTQGGRES
jgi:hypothetical protein